MSRSRPTWTPVVASAVGMMFGTPLLFGALPLFLKPVTEDLGWGRTDLSLLFFGASMGIILVGPLVGRAIDRWGVRSNVALGSMLFGLSIMALSLLRASVAFLIMIGFLLGCAAAAKGSIPHAKVISSLFQTNRGLMLALVLGVTSNLGLVAATYIAGFVIEGFGWRTAFVILGAIALVVNTAAALWLPPRSSLTGPAADAPARPTEEGEGMSAKQALTSPTFWIIVGTAVITVGGIVGLHQHLAALLDDRGPGGTGCRKRRSTTGSRSMAGWRCPKPGG